MRAGLAALGLALVLISCGGKGSRAKPTPVVSDPNLAPGFRLSDASIPKAYHLRLKMDPELSKFTGEVTIDVELTSALHTLWLHQKNLDIAEASFHREGRTLPLEQRGSKADAELLGLAASEELSAGPGQIRIRFSGDYGSREALFRQMEAGVWYAYSDFEATDARAAFPCYDEPRFKVPWLVEVQVPEGNLAFANAPEVSRDKLADGSWLFRFAKTSPLPSYLVAVAAGPFDLIEGKASSTPMRIIAPRGQAQFGRYILESTDQWIRYLEAYLDMAMPFPKLDFIAVPQFGGAMENPGLVTFSSNILLNPPGSHPSQLRRAAGITAHELAHMWFGNLITPVNWGDLWLNEAFATWLSDKVVAQHQPAAAREVLDIVDKTAAYASDHSLDGRTVRQEISSRQQIRDAFDTITYRKGGALLTMLESWIGDERMRIAVRAYLHKHEGGSVNAGDMISAFVAAAPKAHLEEIIQSYLLQPGIPTVAANLRCKPNRVEVELVQSRTLLASVRGRADKSAKDALWSIPICLSYPSEAGTIRQCTLLQAKRKLLALRTKRCPKWVLPNESEKSYYHYRLDNAGFAALEGANLDPREILGLVHNLSVALRSGSLSVAHAMDRLETWAPTGGLHVQMAVIPLLQLLERSVVGPGEVAAFEERIRRWYGKRIDLLGMKPKRGESRQESLLRPVFVHLLSELGNDKELQANARAIAEAWLTNPTTTDLQLQSSVLTAAALAGDAGLAAQYLDALKKSKQGAHSVLLVAALHAFQEPELFKAALEISVPEELDLPTLMPVLLRALQAPRLRQILTATLIKERVAILVGKGSTGDDLATERGQENYQRVAELFASLCDAEGKAAARRFAGDDFDAGPVVEAIEECMAFAAIQAASAKEAFAGSSP